MDTENSSKNTKAGRGVDTTRTAIIGGIIVLVILIGSTIWMGQSAKKDTEEAVRAVSLLYLDELAGRREMVVENNMNEKIRDLGVAIELMDGSDLSDMEHLQAYQAKMKKLYNLEKFAFVDSDGLIYTSLGTRDNIADYKFDYDTLSEPEISILNPDSKDKKVIIAVPVDIDFMGKKLKVCFMEIDMDVMLAGVSMDVGNDETTFCNIYTKDGVALTDTVLGGLSAEDNLLEAMEQAEYDEQYSLKDFLREFGEGVRGEVSFTYNGVKETLSYVPVSGTDWMLTYLIRESVISGEISSISRGIMYRSIMQSVLMILVLVIIFGYIFRQNRQNLELVLERETANAELRGKQEELDERIKLQEQLEEQSQALSQALAAAEQASRAKTVFLSNMSHEIRTPMNAIIGLDNIARNDPETTDKIRGYLEQIDASAGHLLSLINDILDMSRIEAGRMVLKNEEFSFQKLLESVNTMFSGQAADKGIDYQCHINSEVDDYYIGDSMKLRQVLINILGNAVKFTPEGGSVNFDIVRKAQYDNKTTLQFTISDTGIGVSEEFLPHIFDSFAQEDAGIAGKYGSSGLGLAITRSIVEMMNGDIKVESVKGEGTVMTVTVTLADAVHDDSDGEYAEIHPEDMSVLIVDDDPVACEHARLVLEKAGIAAETAGSGLEAIEHVKLRQARMQPYNLILVDWKMPDMDGVETTRRIREITEDKSAIIILTAYRWDDILEDALHAGVDSFIAKPLFAATVIEEFRNAMQKKKIIMTESVERADLNGRRLLMAEDVPVNAEIMMKVLEMRGMEVEVAENGRIAVDLFASRPEGYYDAILMDMRMPEMDGLEATTVIRKMDRADAGTIPIIALTANAFDEDVQRSLQAGLNAHLSKPVQPDSLYDTLEKLIK